MKTFLIIFTLFGFCSHLRADEPKLIMADLIAQSQASDWRELKPENTVYMELSTGRVIIELAPDYAPKHVANIKALAREKYWDGLAVVRVQDNYVVQWADPQASDEKSKKKIKNAKPTLAAEFDRAISKDLPFTSLGDADVYAPEVGFSSGFAVARDQANKKTWLIHCYGAVGAGRDMAADSGGGTELYAVIGHSPRHLDRNVTLVGRVIQGIELLSALPRGKGALGFYDKPELNVPILSVRLASDVPKKERTSIEVLRTDTALFKNLIASRRSRQEEWFINKAAHVEVCNVPVISRVKK